MTVSASTPTIESGLAKYEPDYYAILGVPLNADNRLIRKGYLNTAKHLHPDRYIGQPKKRETANWLFSKLISHASEILNREKDRVEYREVLRLRAKRLISLPPSDVWPESHYVDSLLQATDLETTYSDTILNLAAHQYKDLEKAITCTEELSKINLAYLLLSNGYKVAAPPSTSPLKSSPAPAVASGSQTSTRSPKPPTPSVRPQQPPASPSTPAQSTPTYQQATQAQTRASSAAAQSSVNQPRSNQSAPEPEPPPANPGKKRYDQAKQMMSRKLYKEAIQFLNIAIESEPSNPEYYYERGLAFQKINNTSRARQDFQRVLSLDPEHERAASKLKSSGKKTAAASAPARQPNPQPSASRAKSNGASEKKGVFGRLFNR